MISDIKIFTCVATLIIYLLSVRGVHSEKYKFCVVDGKGGFKRSGRFCPILDKPDSKVECVIGVDRLDCLRRISKGTVDFSVFTPEDLVTAINSEIEILVTNELRYTKDNYEYEIVAVIQDSSGIKSRHDLKDKSFCHPGYGYATDWTRMLADYLEASLTPPSCKVEFTLTENRIKASSQFFKNACKAGPWVNNPMLDQQLKRKYPNLCSLCDIPSKCSTSDKYWGRRGSLYCLTDGAGEISWARLDDVNFHFGLDSNNASMYDGYSFLCPDDTVRPLNSKKPCVWVVKPWPVIATKRSSAQEIQELMSSLNNAENYSWQSALLSLIEVYRVTITDVKPIEAIESFLGRASGFLSANSFSGCHPPRTIRICTTSIIENAKCSWLRESAVVYGIEPDLDCLKADNTTHCMEAINNNFADVVMVPPNLLASALHKYNLKTLFYETVNDDSKYITVALTKNNSGIDKIADLQGVKACFPTYDGIAWNTVVHTLKTQGLTSSCPNLAEIESFFGSSCVPNLPKSFTSKKLQELCDGDTLNGEFGALKCLIEDRGQVAFVSKNSLSKFIQTQSPKVKMDDFNVICDNPTDGCQLSWSPVGQAMVRSNMSSLWMKDTLDVFLQLDNLFGREYKSLTTPLQLFGLYDGKSNVLFNDNTVKFRQIPSVKNFDFMQRPYEEIVKKSTVCEPSSGFVKSMSYTIILLNLLMLRFL